MSRAQVVYQTRRSGGGTVWVHRPRGTWRAIRFESGPGQLAKMLGLCSVLDRLGSATTTVLPGSVEVAQSAPGLVAVIPLAPRAGPACQPITAQAP